MLRGLWAAARHGRVLAGHGQARAAAAWGLDGSPTERAWRTYSSYRGDDDETDVDVVIVSDLDGADESDGGDPSVRPFHFADVDSDAFRIVDGGVIRMGEDGPVAGGDGGDGGEARDGDDDDDDRTGGAPLHEERRHSFIRDALNNLKNSDMFAHDLKPREIVRELDRNIVGQHEAKRAVAIAMRNRWRRYQLPKELRDEILPKNILMIGSTGVGKTEVARRLARMCKSPFLKVEATKFTEVGYHGRDVDSIIRDLVDVSIHHTRERLKEENRKLVMPTVEDRILSLFTGAQSRQQTRDAFLKMLRAGDLEDRVVELDTSPPRRMQVDNLNNQQQFSLSDVIVNFESMMGSGKRQRRRMKVSEAREVIAEEELERLVEHTDIIKESINAVEQSGIVFVDEIDKICSRPEDRQGPDASAEGVQRDLLPLIEGTTVQTRHGNVRTDHILFVASGAFHTCKPSDLLAELQGRLPIRVELKALDEDDLLRILTEPESNLIRQQVELLRTERVELTFEESALKEIARVAAEVNRTVENIGARRLNTVLERIVEEISYTAPDVAPAAVEITKADVRKSVGDMLLKTDMSRYVL